MDEMQRRYRRAPCGLFTSKITGEILDANDTFADWIGLPAAELTGARFLSLLDPQSRLFYDTRHGQTLLLDKKLTEVALSLRDVNGRDIPVLVSAIVEDEGGEPIVRAAVFGAANRTAYERDLMRARRAAEASEARVRILQDVTGAFGSSANDLEVAETFVAAAQKAFSASEAAVHLFDDDGELRLVAGKNPLVGIVQPIDALRYPACEVVLSVQTAAPEYPQVAEGLRTVRRDAISVMPLLHETERLGVLVCFFAHARDFDQDFRELQQALGRQAAQTLTRVRLQRRLEELAHKDALTGIANRQSVGERLRDAVREAQEVGHPLAVIFLDLDDFKSVNDTLGHAAGDDVLRAIAERLRTAVRAEDVVGRIGGDEFVAICADADAEGAASIAARIRAHAHETIPTATITVEMSVSIGVAVYDPATDEPPSPDQLLIRADGAMYLSKESGKDRISVERRRAGRT